jgi:hypothetical protein
MEDSRRRGCAIEPSRPRVRPHPNCDGRSYPKTISKLRSTYTRRWETLTASEGQSAADSINKEKAEDSIRAKLSGLSGQPAQRIDELLAHGEYLTEECIVKLGKRGACKAFFDSAQPVKAILIKNMLIKGLDQKEIEEKISKAVLEMRKEYQGTAKIDRRHWLQSQIETTETKPTWASGTKVFGKPQILKYRPALIDDDSTPKSRTIEDIPRHLDDLAMEVRETSKRGGGKQGELAQKLGRLIIEMAKVYQGTLHQGASSKENTEDGHLC